MKVFIIGPEGAGKTIFATMLHDYVTSEQGNLRIKVRAGDIATKKYLAKELNVLKHGEWPNSTKEGKQITLNWIWEVSGRELSFQLADSAGQDIRSELSGEQDQLHIKQQIQDADILIILVDIYGHQSDAHEKKIENAWIIEESLKIAGEAKMILIGVSKADLIPPPFKREYWQNTEAIVSLFKEYMPEFNFEAFRRRLQSSKTSIVAFSAVSNTSNRSENGRLIRFPQNPLNPIGIDIIAQEIVRIVKKKNPSLVRKLLSIVFFWIPIIIVSLFILIALVSYILTIFL